MEQEIRRDLCFVCERSFAPAEAPAETWAAGAEGEHVVHVCRDCIRNPPSAPPPSLEALPEALRQPLTIHLSALVMRHRTRRVLKTAERSKDAGAQLGAPPGSRRQPLRGRSRDDADGSPSSC